MLEAIGTLSIIGFIIILVINYYNSLDSKKHGNGMYIKHSTRCQDLIYDYNKSLDSGKPIMSAYKLQKELNRIVSDSNERKYIDEFLKSKVEDNQKWMLKRKEFRKTGYKYENDIFEIFNSDRELSREEILMRMPTKYFVNGINNLENIFSIWHQNDLITLCAWNKNKFHVGDTLTDEEYKIIESDLTHTDWLKLNKIILKEHSIEYNEYLY